MKSLRFLYTPICLVLALFFSIENAAIAVNRQALLVGYSQYARSSDGLWNVSALTDAYVQAAILVKYYGFKGVGKDITILKTPEQATKENILSKFRSVLIDNTSEGDIVYFHFSGIGSRVKDLDGDEIDGYDETILPSDYTSATDRSNDITDDEILKLIQELNDKNPGSVTLTFDCSFIGSSGKQGRLTTRGCGSAEYTGVNQRLGELLGGLFDSPGEWNTLGNTTVICSSRSAQNALEIDTKTGKPMGLLTYCLARCFSSCTKESTWRDVAVNLSDLMARYTDQRAVIIRKPSQKPDPKPDGTQPPAPDNLDVPVIGGLGKGLTSNLLASVQNGKLVVESGEIDGLTAGSVYSIKNGKKDLGNAIVTKAELMKNSTLSLGCVLRVKPNTKLLAVPLKRDLGDNALALNVDSILNANGYSDFIKNLKSIELVSDLHATNYDLCVRPAELGDAVLERADGTEVGTISQADMRNSFIKCLCAESKRKFLMRLENPNGVKVRLDVKQVKTAGSQLSETILPLSCAMGQNVYSQGEGVKVVGESPSKAMNARLLLLQSDESAPDFKGLSASSDDTNPSAANSFSTYPMSLTPKPSRTYKMLCWKGNNPLSPIIGTLESGRRLSDKERLVDISGWSTAGINIEVKPSGWFEFTAMCLYGFRQDDLKADSQEANLASSLLQHVLGGDDNVRGQLIVRLPGGGGQIGVRGGDKPDPYVPKYARYSWSDRLGPGEQIDITRDSKGCKFNETSYLSIYTDTDDEIEVQIRPAETANEKEAPAVFFINSKKCPSKKWIIPSDIKYKIKVISRSKKENTHYLLVIK